MTESEEERLKLKSLKWQSGYRKIFVTMFPIIVLVISFFINQYFQTRQDRYERAIKNLSGVNKGLQLSAIDDLKESIETSHYDLFDAFEKSSDPEIREKIYDELLLFYQKTKKEDLINYLKSSFIEEQMTEEDLAEARPLPDSSESVEKILTYWIYVGNFNTSFNYWVNQKNYLGYRTALSYEEVKEKGFFPDSLVSEILTVSVPDGINLRSDYPKPYLAPVVGRAKLDDQLKVVDVSKVIRKKDSPTYRIWFEVEKID